MPSMRPAAVAPPSAKDLVLAREALASVEVHGTPCLVIKGGSRGGDLRGAGHRLVDECLLLTSSGSRKVPSSSGVAGDAGRGASGVRQQQGSRFDQIRREIEQRMPAPAAWKARVKEEMRPQWDSGDSRLSPVVEVAVLLAECIKANLRTIAFCKTRKLCELVATYAR